MCSSWCTTTVLACKILRSLANWILIGHDDAGIYSFSLFLQSLPQPLPNCETCLEQSIIGWHSASLWPFACENIPQWGYTVYWCDRLASRYCDMYVSFGLNLSYSLLLEWWTGCHINFQYSELVLEGVPFSASVYNVVLKYCIFIFLVLVFIHL